VQANAGDESLTPVPLPDLGDEGPHFAYAVQWFLFAGVAAVGYPILLRARGASTGRPSDREGAGRRWGASEASGGAAPGGGSRRA